MKNSLKTQVQDTLVNLMDSLQAHPILKGALPALGSVGLSFIEWSIPFLRWLTLIVGLAIGCLTLYVKWKEAKKLSEK